jgi:hypothetical protein
MVKILKKINKDNENGARHAVIEDLFYDFYRHKHQVYWMNFTRGLFFGVGSVLGGTVIIAILIGVLSHLVDLPGGIGSFIQYVVDTVQKR